MKQKNLIVVAAVVILFILGAGGIFLFSKNSSPVSQTQNQQQTQEKASNPKNPVNTLVNLLTSGQSVMCTFEYSGESKNTSSGTVYIANGNMKGEFDVTDKDGKKSHMQMIRNGDSNYIWGDEVDGGIKMTLATKDLESDTSTNQYFDFNNNNVNYDCSAWSADNSVFTPPTDIKFTDLSSMMPKKTDSMMQKDEEDTSADAMDACAEIEDPETKTACESAMKQYKQ